MCEIKGDYTRAETYTGYKVVIQDKYGHYYSPYTGIRYKPGKIAVPKKLIYEKNGSTICDNKYMHPMWHCNAITWNTGMTGVLCDKSKALYLQGSWMCPANTKMAVLEMTISGNLKRACMSDEDTVIGNNIVSFKKIK